MQAWLPNLAAAAVVILLMMAALADVAARIIPNGLTVGVALLGVAGRMFAGLPGIAGSAAAALALFAVLVVLHGRRMMGGGDVKLAAATVLGLPVESVFRFIFITALAGGVLALLQLALRVVLRAPPRQPPRGSSLLRRVLAAEHWRIVRHGSVPYGVAIACGGIWAILASRGG